MTVEGTIDDYVNKLEKDLIMRLSLYTLGGLQPQMMHFVHQIDMKIKKMLLMILRKLS